MKSIELFLALSVATTASISTIETANASQSPVLTEETSTF